jgi:zinc and cadmium transporter
MLFELFAALTLISLVSLIGVIFLGVKTKILEKYLESMVAFAVGALLGDAFIHLLPELSESGFSFGISLTILLGMVVFFILEKVIHWHHCHHADHTKVCETFGYMSLAGDVLHNFMDGLILAGAFLASPVIGFSTAIAIFLHELPQEIGDFGVLLKSGFSQKKALLFNFLISLTAFLGALVALFFSGIIVGANEYFVAFATGSFLYIAAADLVPQLNKHFSKKQAILQVFFIVLGIVVMASLLLLE